MPLLNLALATLIGESRNIAGVASGTPGRICCFPDQPGRREETNQSIRFQNAGLFFDIFEALREPFFEGVERLLATGI